MFFSLFFFYLLIISYNPNGSQIRRVRENVSKKNHFFLLKCGKMLPENPKIYDFKVKGGGVFSGVKCEGLPPSLK